MKTEHRIFDFYAKRCGLKWGVFFTDPCDGKEREALIDTRFWSEYTAESVATAMLTFHLSGFDLGMREDD